MIFRSQATFNSAVHAKLSETLLRYANNPEALQAAARAYYGVNKEVPSSLTVFVQRALLAFAKEILK